jgi:II/X family phage/plasmid replication protein
MKTLEIAEATMIEAETIEGLPYRLQRVYKDWKDGLDLRQVMPRRTFYKYRSELKEFGIDIAIKQDAKEVQQSNVVPLKVVLHGYPVGIPDWAKGTSYLFEPSKQSA